MLSVLKVGASGHVCLCFSERKWMNEPPVLRRDVEPADDLRIDYITNSSIKKWDFVKAWKEET